MGSDVVCDIPCAGRPGSPASVHRDRVEVWALGANGTSPTRCLAPGLNPFIAG